MMEKVEESKINEKSPKGNCSEIMESSTADKIQSCTLEFCCDRENCLSLDDILRSFNAPLSEEQAWSLIYQSVLFYRNFINVEFIDKNTRKDCERSSHRIKVPKSPKNLNIHKDGSVHINDKNLECCLISSQKKILLKIGIVVYTALDFNLSQDEECIISSDLEQLINLMTYEEIDDEGIERDSEDIDDEKFVDSKELDHILELCAPRVLPSNPDEHYRAVCRALTTESIELRVFLSKVFTNDAEALRIKADAQSSRQELAKLDFRDWARFWMQVVDELRRGVRLKKINFHHTPTEYALTPYEILMEDIRSRRYQLRKVMVNGNIPPRVKKDARAVILEFIRSRPPLRKATDRKLAPLKRNPSPREQLLDSIRKGKVLKPIAPGLKNRLLPPSTTSTSKAAKLEDICRKTAEGESSSASTMSGYDRTMSQPSRRLISVDFSLFKDDETPPTSTSTSDALEDQPKNNAGSRSSYHQSRTGKEHENNQNNINTILRRTTYDLATQCESRRASLRRHTIVGCQSFKSLNDSHSVPPSRPQSRQSTEHSITSNTQMSSTSSPAPVQQQQHQQYQQQQTIASSSASMANNHSGSSSGGFAAKTITPQQQQLQQPQYNSNLNSISSSAWGKNSLDEQEWREKLQSDRLSLTLEEIVHIRSVITKAELESLPMGIQIKEDVEKRKLCFLCLRTKFGILGPRGVPCKLCQRTVCAKCYTKMRIPTEHFSNVPVQLLSPSRQNSPSISNVSSPSHAGAGAMDESFPRSLMERLLRTDVDRKSRNTVGSAPASPRNQRSASSTPGSSQPNSLTIINNGVPIMTQIPIACAKDSQTSMRNSLMSRSMDGPKSLQNQSPRSLPQSNCSTLDRRSTLKKAFGIMQPQQQQQHQQHLYDQKEGLRGELMAVCNDCRGLVLNIIRYSRKTRSSARNMHLKNLTLDLSPVYKR